MNFLYVLRDEIYHLRKDSWFNMELVNICDDWAETACELDTVKAPPFVSNGSNCDDRDALLLGPELGSLVFLILF